MLIAGDHVPDTPLVLVVGNGGMLSPEQKGPTGLNVGVTGGPTLTVIVVVMAQVGIVVDVGVNV